MRAEFALNYCSPNLTYLAYDIADAISDLRRICNVITSIHTSSSHRRNDDVTNPCGLHANSLATYN